MGRRRTALRWLRAGGFDASVRWMVIATAIISGAALLVWYLLAGAGVREFRALIPPMAPWALPLAALAFALGNAAAEEAAYRSVVMHALAGTLGSAWPTIFIQALAFGLAHVRGFPQGVSGVALATVYGLMLGAIRWRADGMLAPWLAHVVADLVLFAILVLFVAG